MKTRQTQDLCSFWTKVGSRIAQSVLCWACCLVLCSIADSTLLWASGKRDFSLWVNMGSHYIAENSFRWEYKPRSSLCTHTFHSTDSKGPDVHILDRWMLARKTHPACTIHEDGMWLPQWLDEKKTQTNKKDHTCTNLTKKWRTPEILLGTQKKKKEEPRWKWRFYTEDDYAVHRAWQQ